jgi:hypothetical protein
MDQDAAIGVPFRHPFHQPCEARETWPKTPPDVTS